MQLTLSLCLPRDHLTVPVARRVVRSSMEVIGVDDDAVSSIEIALSEACTNVLKHSGPGDEYEVRVDIDDDVATIEVVDRGHGFDSSSLVGDERVPPTAERGRGIELMKALVDSVRFESKPADGTIVHLEKRLDYAEDSIVRRLASSP
jgi:serine/threonine-protein kinase RsbW